MGTSVYYQSNIIDSEADAAIRLAKLVEKDSTPALSDDDIQQLLDDHKVATIWAASTTYYLGDKVVPSKAVRNGHMFVAVTNAQGATSGISDVTEPIWPMGAVEEEFRWRNFFSRNMSDGTVMWRECGPETDLWDIRAAAHEGWIRKGGKAANMFDTVVGGDRFFCSQVKKQCDEMAKSFNDLMGVA